MENELYAFVVKEFAFAYAKQFPNGNIEVLNQPTPNFRYEKIYPKPQHLQKKKGNINPI